ncbi:MAG: response regulator [Taibaiella sp.]|nr:response regulator [Taibaiella sp.]
MENSNRIKIYIVEDQALIAAEIKRSLEGLGYEVCGLSYDYASAAEAVLRTEADLFMLDINLDEGADKTGISLANLIKTNHAKPFIFLTAYNDTDTIKQATATQPANYLIKPVNPAAMFAAIQLAIARGQEPHSLVRREEEELPDFFYVKIGQRKEQFFWRDVIGMGASKNYVRVFLKDRHGEYPVRGTIAFVVEQLVPAALRKYFIKVGRSLSLNSLHITEVNEQFVICGNHQFENTGRIKWEQLKSTGGRQQ